jgi:hypothetical protein
MLLFYSLTESSPCDNVLLEHWFGLELLNRGLIEKICPIYIGDEHSKEGELTARALLLFLKST